MSVDDHGNKFRRYVAENFNQLSRVRASVKKRQTDRQTDGRTVGRQHIANANVNVNLVNVNVSSRSLKRFTLFYRTVAMPCLFVTLVYYGQTVG